MDAETQLKALKELTIALAQAIHDLGSVPSGHLYARVMGSISLPTYQMMIAQLEKTKLVKNENHLLTWIGE